MVAAEKPAPEWVDRVRAGYLEGPAFEIVFREERRALTVGGWCAVLMNLCVVVPTYAQSPIPAAAAPGNLIDVTFVPAPALAFPNPTDSNSPAFGTARRSTSSTPLPGNRVAPSGRACKMPRMPTRMV
jgi:hypothetical protein